MAQSSWPFENVDTSETQFSQWARNIGEGVKTGALNELEVFADSTGMQVKVSSGQAMVRGHYYQSTAQETLPLTAADLTNPRIDTVVIELDPSANSIVLKVIAGAPGLTPAPEPLVQTDAGIYQFKLAEVLVDAAATTIAAGKVTDFRTYIEDFTGTVPGSAITGEITVATIGQSRVVNLVSDLAAKAPLTPSVNAKTGAYTLTVGDRGEFVTCDGTFTITVPGSVFAAGDRVDFVNIGAGVITFAGSGLTLNSVDGAVTIDTQWAGATVFFTSATTAVLIGRLA